MRLGRAKSAILSSAVTFWALLAPSAGWGGVGVPDCRSALVPIVHPAADQARPAQALWQGAIHGALESRTRTSAAAYFDFTNNLEVISRMAEAHLSFDVNWQDGSDPAFHNYIQENLESLTPILGDDFAYDLRRGSLGAWNRLRNQYVLYGLSLVPTGRRLLAEALPAMAPWHRIPLSIQYGHMPRGARASYMSRENGQMAHVITLDQNAPLLSLVMLLAHEIEHANDDVTLGLFTHFEEKTKQQVFVEHRAHLAEFQVAREWVREFPRVHQTNQDLINAVTMNHKIFEYQMTTAYAIPPAVVADYFADHVWEVMPSHL